MINTTGAYKLFPPSKDYPNLTKHNNTMAHHLTPQVNIYYVHALLINYYTGYNIGVC